MDAQTQLEPKAPPPGGFGPCLEWFDAQDEEYRESVLPTHVRARVSVEAGVKAPWYKYLGTAGRSISIEEFGASADAGTMFEKFGFTASAVVEAAKASISAAN